MPCSTRSFWWTDGMPTPSPAPYPWPSSSGATTYPWPGPAAGDLCTDTCQHPGDGDCDDGGPGSIYSLCEYGTDCSDCGPRSSSNSTYQDMPGAAASTTLALRAPAPAATPAPNASRRLAGYRCYDYPGWRDSHGFSCVQYAENHWCTPGGAQGQHQGPASDASAAFVECCACGGGYMAVSPAPSRPPAPAGPPEDGTPAPTGDPPSPAGPPVYGPDAGGQGGLPGWIHLSLPFAIALLVGSAVASVWFRVRPPTYQGRMVAVPNREDDLYSRLWCVYEMFAAKRHGVPVELARTLASAGTCKAEQARCSSADDTSRIRSEIEAGGRGGAGYAEIDRAVRQISRSAHWGVVSLLFSYFARPVVATVACAMILTPINSVRHESEVLQQMYGQLPSGAYPYSHHLNDGADLMAHLFYIAGAWCLITMTTQVLVMYWLVKVPQGKPTTCRIFTFGMSALVAFALTAIAVAFPWLPAQVVFAVVLLVTYPSAFIAVPLLITALIRVSNRCVLLVCQALLCVVGLLLLIAFCMSPTPGLLWHYWDDVRWSGGAGGLYAEAVLWLLALNTLEGGRITLARWKQRWGVQLVPPDRTRRGACCSSATCASIWNVRRPVETVEAEARVQPSAKTVEVQEVDAEVVVRA